LIQLNSKNVTFFTHTKKNISKIIIGLRYKTLYSKNEQLVHRVGELYIVASCNIIARPPGVRAIVHVPRLRFIQIQLYD